MGKRIALALIVVGLVLSFIGICGVACVSSTDEISIELHRSPLVNASFDMYGYEQAMKEVVAQQGDSSGGGQDWMTQTFDRDKVGEYVDYVNCHGHSEKASSIPLDFSGL